MATESTTFPFRPQNKNLEFWRELRRLCKARNVSVSGLLNAIMPAITAELAKQPKNPPSCYEFNLGVIQVDTIP